MPARLRSLRHGWPSVGCAAFDMLERVVPSLSFVVLDRCESVRWISSVSGGCKGLRHRLVTLVSHDPTTMLPPVLICFRSGSGIGFALK